MRTPARSSSIVRAVDLRDRRQRLGLSSDRMADYLEVADCKHVSAIEIGRCGITMEKAVRSAYVLGAVTVELPGLGRAVVIPIREADAQARPVRGGRTGANSRPTSCRRGAKHTAWRWPRSGVEPRATR